MREVTSAVAGVLLRASAADGPSVACHECAQRARLRGPSVYHGGHVSVVCAICDEHVTGPMTLDHIETDDC